MMFRAMAYPLAFATSLSLSSFAFAQTMVGDQEISDADLPTVTEHCEMLAGNGMAASSAADSPDAADDDAAISEPADQAAPADAVTTPEAEGDAAAEEVPAEGGVADQGTVDLEAITLEECRAAGLVAE